MYYANWRRKLSVSSQFAWLLAAVLIVPTAAAQLRYAGVNLAGAEFGEGNLPGQYGVHYIYPTAAEVDYFTGKGMNTIRLPFRWERLQQSAYAAFDGAELARLDAIVTDITGKNAYVILDPHNYARYYGGIIGQGIDVAVFADFWSRLAQHYKNNPRVIFGLMNEPHTMPTGLWRDDANAAIAAIRAAGATNLILVPGNAWTGAHSWNQTWYGTANAVEMLAISDPGNNYAFELHQYLDGDSSGTSGNCISDTIGSQRLAEVTGWLRDHGKRGFLGEFAGGRNPTCYAALDDLLGYIDANDDVWIGWTYWAAGPWWGEYIFTLEPDAQGADRPQMTVLEKHLNTIGAPPDGLIFDDHFESAPSP
jgi:endoglucanase